MKKVIFCAVALMIGAVGLAQTTPDTPDAPTNAIGLAPLPAAPADANKSMAIQNGNDNKVLIQQVGTYQGAYSDQDNGSGAGFNQGRIGQTGNVTANSGESNMAELYQRGTLNQSTQWQLGDGNESLVRQGSTDNGSIGNRAFAQQGDLVAQQAEDNKLEITQNGDLNQARTHQRFDNNEAVTDQEGDLNYADIFQNAQPNQSDGHTAEVTQDGLLNDAWVRQDGVGGRNEAVSRQDGTSNYSDQYQWSTDPIDQNASNNAAVFQNSNGANPMTVTIDSDMNTNVDAYHVGGNSTSILNTAFQYQFGDDNDAAAFQKGQDNYSEQAQVGDENDALTIQNFYDPNGANGNNYAKQTQVGDWNVAGIGQNGYNNRALQSQLGDDNKALSVQQGHDNDVNVHQIGDNNSATTAQRAACNDALVVQWGGQSAVVEQNLLGGAGNNTAHIIQSGPAGPGSDIDCGFDPELQKKARVDIPIFNIADVCPGC